MLSRKRSWAIAAVAMLTMTVSYVDRATLAVLAPSVTKALDISESAYGWLTSAFSIAYLFATPLSGWWIGRAGARRGLLASVLVWSGIAAMHALVPGFGVLFALRIMLGIAEGPSFPGATQTMYRVLGPADRSRGFGMLFTGSSIGSMIAPPLAGLLFGLAGWRTAFLATAAIGLVWIPIWLVVTGGRAAAQLDGVTHERPRERPAFGVIARHPMMIRAFVSILAIAPAVNVFAAWGSKYLVRRFDIHQEDVGHYLWVPPLCLDVGALLFGDLVARTGRPRALYVVAALMTMTLGLLPFVETPWQAMAVLGVTVGGGGAVYTITTADMLGRMPPEAVSVAGGLIVTAQSIALIVANPLVGRAVDYYGNYDGVAIVVGLWVLPGTLLWLLWRPSTLT